MSVINAWILYKLGYNPKVGQKAFRLFIIEEWLEQYRTVTRNVVKKWEVSYNRKINFKSKIELYYFIFIQE